MYPQELGTIPEETACVARAAFPKGTLAMRLRDAACGELYQDEQFAVLYPVEGQPAYARFLAGDGHGAAICRASQRPKGRWRWPGCWRKGRMSCLFPAPSEGCIWSRMPRPMPSPFHCRYQQRDRALQTDRAQGPLCSGWLSVQRQSPRSALSALRTPTSLAHAAEDCSDLLSIQGD